MDNIVKGSIEVLEDISNAPINVGDLVVVRDDVNGLKYRFEVVKVHKEVNRERTFTTKIIESNNPTLSVGSEINFNINRDVTVYGCIVRKQDKEKVYKDYEINEIAAYELLKLINSLENKKIQFSLAITYLIERNIFATGQTEEWYKVKLRNICKEHSHVLRSSGGYIFSKNTEFRTVGPAIAAGVGSLGKIEVDFPKLCTAMRLFLESFSIFKVKNYD